MFLNDEQYWDEQGRAVPRHEVDCLGTYTAMGDGWFKWSCGACGHESHHNRGCKIGGTVWLCTECQKKNLLVRTDIKFLEQKLRAADRNDTSAERAIAKALVHLGQGIAALGQR